MNWTTDQKKIIDARDCNLLVSAAAGSGKTAVLVERIIQMISDAEHPVNIDELLVVTFTKAAAAQMKDKIAKAIERLLEQDPDNMHYRKQMDYVNRANILTIDSFCFQVVKEHFHLLGIDPGIRIGEAGEIGLLRQEVLEEVIEEFYQKDPNFVRFSDAFSSDKNDAKVEEYILKVYDVSASYPQPTEWTRQARAALHVESEEDFMELSYVKAYLAQIKSTAEGIRNRILKALDMARQTDGPLYMEKALLSDIQLVDDILSARTYSGFSDLREQGFANIGRGKKGGYDEDIAEQIKKLRDEYKKQINALLSSFAMPLETVLEQMQDEEPMLKALLDSTDVFRERFLEKKIEKGILEFSDVEHLALQVLCKGYDANGDAMPSRIGEEMSEQFCEILIDEYQDSNYLQEAILRCVSTVPQGRNNIFMVGDVKQSIYGFRMARPDLFMDKYRTYETEEGAACRKIMLSNNFRSRANVLASINYAFYQIMGEDLGGIEYTEAEALVPGREFPEVKDDSVELLLGESKEFEFLQLQDAEESAKKKETLDEELEDIGKMELEASMVAGRMEELLGKNGKPYQIVDEDTGELRDVTYRDMVILLRAPARFGPVFSEILSGRGIPVKVQNEKGYFDTVEIRLLLSLLRMLDNPHNDVELAAVMRSYFGGFRNEELAILSMIRRQIESQSDTTRIPFYSVVQMLDAWGKGAPSERKQPEKPDQADFEGKDTQDEGKQPEEPDQVHSERKDTQDEGKQPEKPDQADSEGQKDRAVVDSVFEKIRTDLDADVWKEIVLKCGNIVCLTETLQQKMTYATIGQILNTIYYDMGYYYYVEAMPEGRLRVRNLDLFLSETKRFEDGPYRSLFDYLRYVDRLLTHSIGLGGDPSPESSENVVRIMSIHKSKGLEFPVVFLSGIGKNFNYMDTKTPLIVHPDYYLGARYVNPEKRYGNDTFSKKAIAGLMITESISEELRVFYVGLTRAKEKLILTGVTPDIPALIKRYEEAAYRKEVKLSYSVVHTANNYLDLMTAGLIRNEAFGKAMKGVRKRMNKNGDAILSAEYEQPVLITEPEMRLKVFVYDFENLVVNHIQSNLEKQMDRKMMLEEWKNMPAANVEQMESNLKWHYALEWMTEQKSKLSVTEIKRIYETDHEPSDVVEHPSVSGQAYEPPLPQFLSGEKPMDAAEKGTWVHKTMELLDFTKVETKEDVAQALEQMWREDRIPKETKTFITADMLYTFVCSNLGKRMQKAAKDGILFKEKQFVVGVPAKRLHSDRAGSKEETIQKEGVNDQIVVQGIIDAYFREGDHLILLDYKTDYVKPGQQEMLGKRYRTQMLYYKDTLEQLTGLPVTEVYIYSFALGEIISLN